MIDHTQAEEQKQLLISNVQEILTEQKTTTKEVLEIAKQRHKHNEFDWARKILEQTIRQRIDDSEFNLLLTQKLALSTD